SLLPVRPDIDPHIQREQQLLYRVHRPPYGAHIGWPWRSRLCFGRRFREDEPRTVVGEFQGPRQSNWHNGFDDEGDEGRHQCPGRSPDVWKCRERIHGEVSILEPSVSRDLDVLLGLVQKWRTLPRLPESTTNTPKKTP